MSKIAFIGAGNMNSAIITGLISNGFTPSDVIVSNPSADKREKLANNYNILHTSDNIEAATFADFIVLGVKPYFIADVCQQISAAVNVEEKCFISVAAGCTMSTMEQALGKPCPIIRTMPNTPSQLGLGVTGLFPSPQVSKQQKEQADSLMKSVGITKWLTDESEIDNIIAVSGSAPAYFFLFMEAMEKEAIRLGFSAQDSRQLIQQTALGAAEMVVQNKDAISTLRENVTSKGGTTQAALSTLIDGGLDKLVSDAMQSAKARAKEMAENNA
ncbi:pyrroline-5-carboxylate reductase [Thalassotalea hakodatensis]|uniref:pyrroline-5-carboxylate reductase n=1 Tax=Thalassotalea hakodatensis TaxID=3030492 RepID=UPI002573389D|nr:pyrroline-5-carboxylate reductase [Thalassotalea hakodatensis]